MNLESAISQELRELERAWDDVAGAEYRRKFLLPLDQLGEELTRAIHKFEREQPKRPWPASGS